MTLNVIYYETKFSWKTFDLQVFVCTPRIDTLFSYGIDRALCLGNFMDSENPEIKDWLLERKGVCIPSFQRKLKRFDATDSTFEFGRCCCRYWYNAGHHQVEKLLGVFFPHCWSSNASNCCALSVTGNLENLHNGIPICTVVHTVFWHLFPSHPSTFSLRWCRCRHLTWSEKISDHILKFWWFYIFLVLMV